ncbi:MAG: hypothetical protein U0790_07260 [Isosphaeraceae bacterium]
MAAPQLELLHRLSGDHIVEQHVHNLDVMNWVLGTHPIRAAVSGLGGRQRGKASGRANYDLLFAEYEHPNGITVFSQCRQMSGCDNIVGEPGQGHEGHEPTMSHRSNRRRARTGTLERYRGPPSPYHQEHQDLIASILAATRSTRRRRWPNRRSPVLPAARRSTAGRPSPGTTPLVSTTRLDPTSRLGPTSPAVAIPGQQRPHEQER